MKRLALPVIFVCLFAWTTDASAQSTPSYQWEPFDGPTMAAQTAASVAWGAGVTFLAYQCVKQEHPGVGCIIGGFLFNGALLGSGLLVSLVGEGMGAKTTELDFLAASIGYIAGFGAGAFAAYGLWGDDDDKISGGEFAGMAVSGVALGTAVGVLGYHLSADPVEASAAANHQAALSSGPGLLGLSFSFRF